MVTTEERNERRRRVRAAAAAQALLAADQEKGQQQADEFNRRYPVGTPVVAYPCTRDCTEHKRLTTETRSLAWTLGHGDPVVQVKGYAGGICLTHVDPVEDDVLAEDGGAS